MPRDDSIDAAELRADIKKALDNISAQVKEEGAKALDEARKYGALSQETKAKVDELLALQAEYRARLLDVEQKQARQPGPAAVAMTAGAMLVGSTEFRAWRERGGVRANPFSMSFNAAIMSTPDTNTTTVGVPADVRPGINLPGLRRLTVRDLVTPGTTSSNAIQYVKETGFTNNAAPVSEGIRKPESTIVYDLVQAPVVTIAHFIKASNQILDDFAGLQSQIDGRLRYGLKLVEENQLLKGSGVGNNLNGIYTQATVYSAPIVIPTPTKIDTIRLMILQSELAEFPATGIVLHPSDWAAIELTKETTGGYIFANPQSLAPAALWGRPVVATQAMTLDTALVGAFQLGAQIFDRQEINVVIATQNEDDFVKNMVTIRCEERLALAVYRPEAFVKNTDLPAS
jgi:HK97 family phage major capsid protein